MTDDLGVRKPWGEGLQQACVERGGGSACWAESRQQRLCGAGGRILRLGLTAFCCGVLGPWHKQAIGVLKGAGALYTWLEVSLGLKVGAGSQLCLLSGGACCEWWLVRFLSDSTGWVLLAGGLNTGDEGHRTTSRIATAGDGDAAFVSLAWQRYVSCVDGVEPGQGHLAE